MPKYEVTALVTISLNGTVEAKSKKEALEKAAELGMPHIHEDYYHDPSEWRTSGELDGEAFDIRASKA